MRTIAVYSSKGGVGKTAAAVNFAWQAARAGRRTLLWDLDPQGAASFYFRVTACLEGGAAAMLERKNRLARAVKGTDFVDLDIIPADFSHRNLDLLLAGYKKRTRRLRRLLAPLEADYDLVLLDCPPGISLVSENALEASDVLLAPLIPTVLSVRTFEQLLGHLVREAIGGLAVIPFFAMVDLRKRMHKEIMVQFARVHPECARTFIPYATEVERMGAERMPVGAFAAASRGARSFEALWTELEREGVAGERPAAAREDRDGRA